MNVARALLLAQAKQASQASRSVATYSDIVVSKPLQRISFQEKCLHGLMLATGVLGYPLYAIFRMADIRKEEYAALEIPEGWAAWKEKQQKK